MRKRIYYENFYASIFENLNKMENFPERAKNVWANFEEKERGKEWEGGAKIEAYCKVILIVRQPGEDTGWAIYQRNRMQILKGDANICENSVCNKWVGERMDCSLNGPGEVGHPYK